MKMKPRRKRKEEIFNVYKKNMRESDSGKRESGKGGILF